VNRCFVVGLWCLLVEGKIDVRYRKRSALHGLCARPGSSGSGGHNTCSRVGLTRRQKLSILWLGNSECTLEVSAFELLNKSHLTSKPAKSKQGKGRTNFRSVKSQRTTAVYLHYTLGVLRYCNMYSNLSSSASTSSLNAIKCMNRCLPKRRC
jgi:hypothetical protein